MRFLQRLPAYVLNGLSVALGIGVIQFLIAAAAGPHAAQLALSGAVCASLADVPNTVARTRYRVTAAALLSFAAALTVTALRPWPVALGLGMAAMGFVAMMTMAWGARAGAVSFAPILSLVFAMAVPPASTTLATLATWNAVGSLAYIGWSLLAGAVLQKRYGAMALFETLRAQAQLLRSRAELVASVPGEAGATLAMRGWIQGEAALAERLQTTRDFVFAEPGTARARRNTAILLHAIDLRDVLLASRLDLELLGSDATGRWVRARVSTALAGIAQALDAAAVALRDGTAPVALAPDALDFEGLFANAPIAAGDGRVRLLPAVVDRLRNLSGDVQRMHGLLAGEREMAPLTRAELQRFVAPEGWPLAALRAQWSWHSPVLRHALRCALALGSAYFIALALPWASHPHWLVLSVAVVLRGNLEQTLSRRNARVGGTLLGCGVVLLLSGLHSPKALGLIFLAAVATAHAFVLQRYWVTAAAATVMALLQSHLVDPAAGFAIAERVADTLLGTALAWAFSYVLPSWERRSLPQAIERVLKTLDDYAGHALAQRQGDDIGQRLARRRAYDALSAMAMTLQRSAAEPKSVQVPVKEVAALLDHGQRLMAHLSMLRLTLARRGSELDGPLVAARLAEARASLKACMNRTERLPPGPALGVDEVDPEELSSLPVQRPSQDILPWLLRRVQVLQRDARHIKDSAAQALSTLAGPAAR